MPDYSYTARDIDGDMVKGTISATNEREALNLLSGQELFPLQVNTSSARPATLTNKRVKGQLMATTYSQLSALLRSGVPLLRSLRILEDQSSNQTLKLILREVHNRVEDGQGLAEAMGAFPKAFSDMAVNMARAFLLPVRKSRGTHLAISSVAGFAPLLNRTAYAASKHAMQGFFASLRAEEHTHGVRCAIAAPSFVATNIGRPDRDDNGIVRPGSASDGLDYMTPEDAARVILSGLNRGRDFIPVGRVARLSYWIMRLSPSLYQYLMRRKISGKATPSKP